MFICAKCNFTGKKKGDWARHITTKKHLKNELIQDKDTTDLKKIILKQQEQIDTQQQQINELIPKIGNITNQRFNLNIFLNDTCKDALNWSEFINTLNIHDTQNIDDIAQLICDELYNIGIYKRPIHCLDVKRKKICIKNQNVWEHNLIKVCDTITDTATTLQQAYLKQWQHNHPTWFENEVETDTYTQLVSKLTVDKEEYTSSITKHICIPKLEFKMEN
jgi:hypothetical protein